MRDKLLRKLDDKVDIQRGRGKGTGEERFWAVPILWLLGIAHYNVYDYVSNYIYSIYIYIFNILQ